MFSGRLLVPNLGCWLQGWFLLWPGLLELGLLISGRYDWIWFNWFQVVDQCFWNLVSDVRVCRNPFQILACALVMCFYFCRSFLEHFSVGALVWQGLRVGIVHGFCKHCFMGRIPRTTCAPCCDWCAIPWPSSFHKLVLQMYPRAVVSVIRVKQFFPPTYSYILLK